MSYRKREIAHWNSGKGCKGTRKAKERVYVSSEIDVQIAEQDENFRYRHYRHKADKEAQLEHRIEWYAKVVAEYERNPKKDWTCSFASYARDGLRKAKKQLKELKDAKVRT